MLLRLPIITSLVLATVGYVGLLHAEPAYEVGENLLANPQWDDVDIQGIPRGWESLVLRPQADATIEVDHEGELYIVFNSIQWMDQARLRQKLSIERGLVYEQAWTYRTGEDGLTLRADVSAIGTGPQFRNVYNPPSENWIRRRLLYHVPENARDPYVEQGEIFLMFQNRSTVPIWYKNPSLRATNIAPEDLPLYQPELRLLSLRSEDVLIMPGTTEPYAYFVIQSSPADALNHLDLEARLYTPDGRSYPAEYVDGRIRVSMQDIPEGTSRLYLYGFIDKDADIPTLVAYARHDIERISEDQISGDLDFTQHAVMVNPEGDPFFPVGIYAGLGWNFSLEELANAGFNAVHSYGTDSWIVREENFKLLNDADELGIWIMMGVPPRYMRDNKYLNDLKQWVKAYRDYPAILMYYADETYTEKGVPPAAIQRAYETVRQADPKRAFYSYEKPAEEIRNTMDGIMLAVRSENVAKVVKLRMGEDMPMLHVFGQQDHHGQVSPSLESLHYEFVMPTLYGARGVFYWMLPAVQTNAQGELLQERLYETASRFAQAAQAIVSEETNPSWTQQIQVSGDAEYLVKTLDGKTYLFCGVHRDANEGALVFELPAGHSVRDVLRAEKVDVSGGVNISLNNGDVRLLEITP